MGAARSQPARREGRGAGRAGPGARSRHAVPPSERREQPGSGSSSALGDPRPCPCSCRAAASDAGEVGQRLSRPPEPRVPNLHPASCTCIDCAPGRGARALRWRPLLGQRRWRRAAPSLPPTLPRPRGEQWCKFRGVRPSLAAEQGPLEKPLRCGPGCRGTLVWDGRGSLRGGRRQLAASRDTLPPPRSSPPRSSPPLECSHS